VFKGPLDQNDKVQILPRPDAASLLVPSEDLSEQPLRLIAPTRLAKAPLGAQSESRATIARQPYQREASRSGPLSYPKEPQELPLPVETLPVTEGLA